MTTRYELNVDQGPRNKPESLKRKNFEESSSNSDEPVVFFAISENRTRECGLAVFSLSSPQIELYQYCDFGGYALTQTMMNLYKPKEVLLPHTAVEGEMHCSLRNYYNNCSYVSVARKFFNENKGL